MANIVTGFTRLKSLFQGGINFTTYDEILKRTINAEVGSLPKDMLSKILSGAKKAKPSEEIEVAKKGFTEALPYLNHGIEVRQRAESINTFKFLNKYLTKEKFISLDFLKEIDLSKLMKLIKEPNQTRMVGLEEASSELTKAFSQIIPNCSKVNVSALGSGSYGMGYKLEFLNSSGDKILHDKVLKLFYQKGMTGLDNIEKNIPYFNKIFDDALENISNNPKNQDFGIETADIQF